MSSNEETFNEVEIGGVGVGGSYTKSLFTFNEADTDFLNTNDFVALDLDGVVDSFKSVATGQSSFAGDEGVAQLEDLNLKNQESPTAPDEVRKKKKRRTPRSLEPKQFFCDLCDETFANSSELKYHTGSIHQMKLYRCEKCSKEFNFEKNLFLHIASHSTAPAICPECGKMFQRLASFVGHLETHVESDNFKCQACGEEFEFEEYYERHLEKDHRGGEIMAALFVKKRKSRNISMGYKGKFLCKTCGRRFPKPSLLLRHEIAHAQVKPFVCLECNKRFSQKSSLDRHAMLHSGIKPHDCPECGMSFAQRTNLITHVKRVHTTNKNAEDNFPCNSCSCVFGKLKSLTRHITLTHSTKTDNNKTKELTFSEILEHIMSLHEVNNSNSTNTSSSSKFTIPVGDQIVPKQVPEVQPVPECLPPPPPPVKIQYVNVVDCQYPTNERVNRMVKEVHIDGIKWLECLYCPKRFQMPFDIVRHLRTHTREKPFKCKYCGRKFALKNTLDMHLKIHKKIPNEITKVYHCTYCQMSFDSIRSLDMHVRIHSNYKPYICSTCFKTFKSSENLRLHKAIHEPKDPDEENIKLQLLPPIIQTPEEKPAEDESVRIHQCEKCGQRFKKSSHLKQHEFSHLSLKAFKCEVCEKYFSTKSSLGFHQKIHLGHKTAPCEVCDKQFCRNSDLKRHRAVHNNFRNFICPYCKKAFKRKSTCKTHIRLHVKDVVTTEELEEDVQSISDDSDNPEIDEDSLAAPNEDQKKKDSNEILFNMVPIHVSSDLNPESNIPPDLNQKDQSQMIFSVPPDLNQASQSEAVFIYPSDLNQTNQSETAIPNLNQPDVDFSIPTNLNQPKANFPVPHDLNQMNEAEKSAFSVQSDLNQMNQPKVVFSVQGNLNQMNQPEAAFSEHVNLNQKNQPAVTLLTVPTELNRMNEINEPKLVFPAPSALNQVIQTETVLSFPSESNQMNQVETVLSGPPDLNQTNHPEIVQSIQNVVVNPGVLTQPGVILLLQPKETNPAEINSSMKLGENLIFVDLRQILNEDNFLPSQDVNLQEVNQPKEVEILSAANSQEIEILPAGPSQPKLTQPEFINISDLPNYSKTLAKNIVVVSHEKNPDSCDSLPEAYLSDSEPQGEEFLIQEAIAKIAERATMKIQKSKPPHACPICKRVFQKPSDLVRHTRTHTKEKPFQCDICSKAFSLKSTLENHKLIHGKDRPSFECHVCGKKYAAKNVLSIHLRLHTGERPFKCDICLKTFRTSGHKTAHNRMHVKAKIEAAKRKRRS